MENDINAGAARPRTERGAAERLAVERPKEYFSVRLTLSGTAQEFDDPRQAGEAFFRELDDLTLADCVRAPAGPV